MSMTAGCIRVFLIAGLVAASTVFVGVPSVEAGQDATSPLVGQLSLVGPAGSETFGEEVVVLDNGNYVVTDPRWDDAAIVDVGAVYLYDGVTNTVISTLTGTTAGDRVGSGGVTALTNGDYVVSSPLWGGVAFGAGAATWVDAVTGINGEVTIANSLYGTTFNDQVGRGVTALTNGNYVVVSPFWTGGALGVGAATWGDGTGGTTGPVTTANSLHGSTANDRVGFDGVTALTNGNYVVVSTEWDNGGAIDVGAATWGDGTGGTGGAVTTTNSLHGTN